MTIRGDISIRTHLITNPLPTKLTLDLPLHHIVVCRPTVPLRQHIQRDSQHEEIDHLVNERSTQNRQPVLTIVARKMDKPITQYHSPIVTSLILSIVVPASVMGAIDAGTWLQDSELLVEVLSDARDERDGWQEDVGDEAVDQLRER